MDLYKLSDIRDDIEKHTKGDDFSATELNAIMLNFFDGLEDTFKLKVAGLIKNEISECSNMGEADCIEFLYKIFRNSQIETETLAKIAQTIADCSDDEDFCENKIYIVIKNFYDETEDYVKEYDSWEEAEKDIDEWYTSCCDDLYLAENLMYPILCAVQGREYDYTMNFCTVIEFNAAGFEEGREPWESENCDFDDCD